MHVSDTDTNVANMVGTLNTIHQATQPKLDSSLDYDVIVVGAGQVNHLKFPTFGACKLTSHDRVACTHCIECANLV